MTAFNTENPNRIVGVPMTPTLWESNVEISVDGDWQYEGATPGFWSTTWRSQVAGNIDNGWFGDSIAFVTSPLQLYEASNAPNRIYNGVMKDYPEDLKKLSAIESDPTKMGKDWYDALPKDIKSEFESLGITPSNMDYDAGTFANDMRQTLAWATYGRDVERGFTEYNDAALFAANIGLSVATDPTSLVSFGAGGAFKGVNGLSKLSNMGLKSTLAMNAGLASVQSADSLIQRDYMSERLGIQSGDLTSGDIATETIKAAAVSTATGAGLYGAGYVVGMGLGKFNRKISAQAESMAKNLVDNPTVFSHQQAEQLLVRMVNGMEMSPKEQAEILSEVLNISYGTHFDSKVWDWDAMSSVGVRPLEMAFKIATEGYSGKQVQDMLNNAYKVLEDAGATHVAPVGPQLVGDNLTESVKAAASEYVPEGPVLPIRKLPDFMEKAGYTWGPLGDLVKDPNKVVAESATEAPAKTTLLPNFVDSMKAADWIKKDMREARAKADKAGATAIIEELSADRKTAREISEELVKIGLFPGMTWRDVRDLIVYPTRGSLGIPSMDTKTDFDSWLANRQAAKPVAPVASTVTPTPPVKQPLLPEVIDPINPPSEYRLTGDSLNDAMVTILKSNSQEEFIFNFKKLLGTVETAAKGKELNEILKQFMDKSTSVRKREVSVDGQRGVVEDVEVGGIDWDMLKSRAAKVVNKTESSSLTPENLIKGVQELTGRKDSIVSYSPTSSKKSWSIEIPNVVDRLIWMTGKAWSDPKKDLYIKGTAEKLLNDYYGIGGKELRQRQTAIKKSVDDIEKGRAPIDRIQVVRNPDGSYSATILRIAQNPKVGPKGSKMPKASQANPNAKADAYATKRNAAIQRALERRRVAFANKTLKNSTPPDVSLTVPGLDREATLAYNQMVKSGNLADAYDLLNNQLVGEGNFQKIRALSQMTQVGKAHLDTALRTGKEADINEAKAYFDGVNRELEKYKERLFAVSDRTFGKLKLMKPLDASRGPLTRYQIGTPFDPAHQFYVEPVGNGEAQVSHQALLILDRAFVSMDPSNLASRIDTQLPQGYWGTMASALTSVNSHLFLQSDAGRLLSAKQPMFGHLANFLAPSYLMNAGDLGTTKISPSLETLYHRDQAEAMEVNVKLTDGLRNLGIKRGTPEYTRAVLDADIERVTGTISSSTKFRAATDLIKSMYYGYADKVNAEGVAVGKIRQADNTYARIVLNQAAMQDTTGVANAFYKANLSYFLKDDSILHLETLQSLRSVAIESDKPVKTLADLKDLDPSLAEEYIKALQIDNKTGPLRVMVDKQIRVRQGLDVTDDINILREASYYMNSGLGKHIDSEILLDPRMHQYIETDIANRLEEYNRNVRYYISRQDAVNRFLGNLTGESIKGITFRDMVRYFKSKSLEHYPGEEKGINAFFDSYEAKEGQITGRGRPNTDGEMLLDAAMITAVAPVQSLVAGGTSVVSSIMESAKMTGSSIFTALHGTGGNRTFIKTMGSFIRSMSKPDILASVSAMMQVQTHGMLKEIDGSVNNYAGGYYLPTKLENMRRSYRNIADAFKNPASTKAAKTHNIAKALGGAMVEPVRQVFHIDNINAINVRGYHSQGMFKMAGVLEQFIKDPDFKTKVTRNEIVNRLEEAGLFSDEAKKGLQAMLGKRPDLISNYFQMRDLNDVLLELKADPKVSNETFAAAQGFYNAFWGAADRFADSRIMSLPRLWDQSNPSSSPAFNRLFNTFSGYSRWFFSRNFQQNFPNSKMHKVAALLAWYTMAEATMMMLRDAMLDFNKFEQMIDDEDDEMFNDYIGRAVIRVPLFGQLTNGAFSAVIETHDLVSDEKWSTSTYRSPSMFSGHVYYTALKEIAKASRGEDYEPEKIRKAVPYLNAPIFGGLLKASQTE